MTKKEERDGSRGGGVLEKRIGSDRCKRRRRDSDRKSKKGCNYLTAKTNPPVSRSKEPDLGYIKPLELLTY